MQLIIKCDDPELFPHKGSVEAAGLDLKASQDYDFYAGETKLVDTGIKVRIPLGNVGLLVARSSLHKRGFTLANAVGIIDSDYRGPIMAALHYNGLNKIGIIAKGERIVQLVVIPHSCTYPILWNEEIHKDWDTERGEGGFGSTGIV